MVESFITEFFNIGPWLQHFGPQWLAKIWQHCFSNENKTLTRFSNNRKRQHNQDKARKVLDKYKRRMMSKDAPAPQDSSYGNAQAEEGPTPEVLQILCKDYVQRLQVSESEHQGIAIRTVQQADENGTVKELVVSQHPTLVQSVKDRNHMHHYQNEYCTMELGTLNR